MSNDKKYYCKRCKNSYPALLNEKGQDKIVEFPSKEIKAATNDNSKKQAELELLEESLKAIKGAGLDNSEKELRDKIAAIKLEKDSNSKIITTGTIYAGRFLTCQHSVNVNDLPISFGDSDGSLAVNALNPTSPDPQYLRSLNIKVTLEFLNMNQDQRENFIAFHVAQYHMHLKAAKEAKYVVQVLEEECVKYIERMGIEKGEEEKKRLMQRYDYVWKKPEKRLEIKAKEEARTKKKEDQGKKTMDAMNKQLEKMRKMMENL